MTNHKLFLKTINKMTMFSKPRVILPCNRDSCLCVNLNFKGSPENIFIYKKCYDQAQKFTSNYILK